MAWLRKYGWELATAGLILAIVLAHVRFALVDPRLPQDPNHCHRNLPIIYDLIASHRLGALPELVFLHTTGWYNLLIACALTLFGKSAVAFQVFFFTWLAMVYVALALIARRLWGGPAALAACALIIPSSEAVVVLARIGWIHVAELGLFMVVLCALVHDPALTRRRTVVLVALAGALGVSIRPSGVIWASTLVPFILSGVLEAERRRRFFVGFGAVLATWALGLVPVVAEFQGYAEHKMASRERYEFLADPSVMLAGIGQDVGRIAAVVCLLATILLLIRFPRTKWRVMALLLLWLVLPFVLYMVLHAGLPNFPAYVVALALLGAGGLSLLPRPVAVLPLLVWLPVYAMQWMPGDLVQNTFGRLGRLPTTAYVDEPLNYYRVDPTFRVYTVIQLLEATCPERDHKLCTILVDRCLFRPHGVEPGQIDLFLLDVANVRVAPIWSDPGLPIPVLDADALASYVCPHAEPDWRARFRDLESRREQVIEHNGFELVWGRNLSAGCHYRWWTRDGAVYGRLPEADPLDTVGQGRAMDVWNDAKKGGDDRDRRRQQEEEMRQQRDRDKALDKERDRQRDLQEDAPPQDAAPP